MAEVQKTLYVNFYENLQEAHIRLRQTVVCYDNIPYLVLAICGHKEDGIFRVYLSPINNPPNKPAPTPPVHNFNANDPTLGGYLDDWMVANPKTRVIRKMMNSNYFNKFRPFPLGMINYGTRCYYLERQPQRHREQGLTSSMIHQTQLTPSSDRERSSGVVELFTPAFHACVTGEHPTADDCLANLLDPLVENEAVAFDRNFALVRGPLDMLFLAYKTDIIASVPKNDFSVVRLGRDFGHCKEVVEELRLFNTII